MKVRAALVAILLVATIAGAFIVIDDTHDQTVGGTKTHVLPVIGTVLYLGLPASPTNGELQYCTDCLENSSPCVGGGDGAMAMYINGQWECIPNTCQVGPTATPANTPVDTPTPIATDTPLIDLLYSGKLNLGANVSGTPLGLVSITADATPAPHDRLLYCTSSTNQVTYTMPPATGSGRVIDMIKADNGAGQCIMNRAGGDAINSGTADGLPNQWNADTCYDVAAGQWACRTWRTPVPTNTPTPTPT